MREKELSTKKKIRIALLIILAWISVFFLGLLLLVATLQSSTLTQAQLRISSATDVTLGALNGLLGIILVLLLLLITNSQRAKKYFFHLRIGLFIGLGIYFLLFAGGLYVNMNPTTLAAGDSGLCLSAHQQFVEHADAVVPIATDQGSGSGFAVSNGSTVLTAFHVIENAKSIYASYSSGRVNMSVIETAPQYDLALLKIDKPLNNFFNLDTLYNVGDEVYAYGYPQHTNCRGSKSKYWDCIKVFRCSRT